MSSLGDFFPDAFKDQFGQDKVNIGVLISLMVPDTKPPKIKRMIVVGQDRANIHVVSVYINSRLNVNVFRTEYMQSFHIRLPSEGRPYLDHDSYIDCTQVHHFSKDELVTYIAHHPEAYLGNLSPADLSTVLIKLAEAPTIKPAIKKRFGLLD